MRFLFASLAADGHFNPLTPIAAHLRESGHEVRWYTGEAYGRRLAEMGIPHLPFRRAEANTDANMAERFPERARLKGPALIRFDFEHVFVNNAEPYFEDVREIAGEYPFEVLVADAGWMGARLVRDVLRKHVIGIGPGTLLATSPDVPPNFVGVRPARTPVGRVVHRAMGAAMDRMVLAHGRELYNGVLRKHGLPPVSGSVFDEFYSYHDVVFLNTVPGFEYPRRRMPSRARFIGMLRPVQTRSAAVPAQLSAGGDRRVVLISQGTVDNDNPGKLIVPALEALLPSGAVLVVGTGRKNTGELRRRFPQENVVIEDYVDFDAVLQRADAFVCNGGHGSVLLSLSHGVPIVGAGVREGKNDINARVEHFGVGVNLRTETPRPEQIQRAVERVLSEPSYRSRAEELRDELNRYRPLEIFDEYVASEIGAGRSRAHA